MAHSYNIFRKSPVFPGGNPLMRIGRNKSVAADYCEIATWGVSEAGNPGVPE